MGDIETTAKARPDIEPGLWSASAWNNEGFQADVFAFGRERAIAFALRSLGERILAVTPVERGDQPPR